MHRPPTAESVKRRRHVPKPLLHLGYELRILHVAPSPGVLYGLPVSRRANLIPKTEHLQIEEFAVASQRFGKLLPTD